MEIKMVKKVLTAAAAVMLMFGVCAYAAVAPSDLVFTQEQGGKFIYCNNHERIRSCDLADTSNRYAKFLMNNEGLTKDRYVLFASFLNSTNLDSEDKPSGKPGFDIETDVVFRAAEDTRITIQRLGFEVPDHHNIFLNGTQYAVEDEWGCMGCWASYFGMPIKQINSGNVYNPIEFEPVTFIVKAGEDVWLSEYIPGYREVPFCRSVNIMADFSIDSGICDVNIAALKSGEVLGDRSRFNKNAAFGSYVRDRQYKGISDGLNEVTAELTYDIDDSDTGRKLPVTVYNYYKPEGNTITDWYTHLNPRADGWSYAVCAESDMLSFKYRDPMKKMYYGSQIPEAEKDEYYYFDTQHTDMVEYKREYGASGKYAPNRVLEQDDSERAYACNLGNYGVIYNYKLKLNNAGYKKRYVIYKLATASNNLVYVKDKSGNVINGCVYSKGRRDARVSDDMACLPVPAMTSAEYTVCVVLGPNYAGGMQNSFYLSDYPALIETYETERRNIDTGRNFTGREYYKWEGETLMLSADREEWRGVKLPEPVMRDMRGNLSEFEIKWTGEGYIIRPAIYDAGAYGHADYMFRYIYTLDESFKAAQKYNLGSYPRSAAGIMGTYYVKTSDTVFYMDNNWKLADIDMPCWNYGRYAAVTDGGKIRLSRDGRKFLETEYLGFTPEYITACGEYYCYADGRVLYLSLDGMYWKSVLFTNKIKSVDISKGTVIVNGSETASVPEFGDTFAIVYNDKFIVPDKETFLAEGVPYVPIRSTARALGFDVTWNNGSVLLKKNGSTAELDDIIIKDSAAYAPLNEFADACGIGVKYIPTERIAVVSG